MTGNLRIDIVYIYFENNSSMICSWWFLHKFSENHHLLSKGKLCTRVLYLHHKQMLNYPASDKILDYIITCQIRGLLFFYHRMLFWIAFEKKIINTFRNHYFLGEFRPCEILTDAHILLSCAWHMERPVRGIGEPALLWSIFQEILIPIWSAA